MSLKSLTAEIKKTVKLALLEDCTLKDVTSDLTVTKNQIINFEITPREDIVFCGKDIITCTFAELKKSAKFKNSKLEIKILTKDGASLKAKKPIAKGKGDAKLIFAAERVLLNLIQHLSGIATATNHFVKTLNNKKIAILDSRKTLPNLRILEKFAVKSGGGKNHRFSLSDMILIKDNHIAAAGNIAKALEAAKKFQKKSPKIKIEIECDTSDQVAEAIKFAPDVIMLDNMKIAELKKSIALIRKNRSKKIAIEVSGGVNINNIKSLSKLEIDFISIGSLTLSAKAVDIGLDVITN